MLSLCVRSPPPPPPSKPVCPLGLPFPPPTHLLAPQRQPDLLPSSLNLPRITAEEYMANFVEVLRNMLHNCPPLVPSVSAVDLLVATAQLQRYMQVGPGPLWQLWHGTRRA